MGIRSCWRRAVDQPAGNKCQVIALLVWMQSQQAPNKTNSNLHLPSISGGPDPAIFMLMAPPTTGGNKSGCAEAIQAKLPIKSGDYLLR